MPTTLQRRFARISAAVLKNFNKWDSWPFYFQYLLLCENFNNYEERIKLATFVYVNALSFHGILKSIEYLNRNILTERNKRKFLDLQYFLARVVITDPYHYSSYNLDRGSITFLDGTVKPGIQHAEFNIYVTADCINHLGNLGVEGELCEKFHLERTYPWNNIYID